MKKIIVFVLGLAVGLTLGSANLFDSGMSWNRGGIEFKPTAQIFLCSASYDLKTNTSTHYNIPQGLNHLVVDC